MPQSPFPHKFIVIEGNIGAGKTTLCEMIAKDYGCRLILEQFADNPFLPFFYENPERYAFPVELFFMTERHKQLQEYLTQQELFQSAIISDYFFIKTLLFAKNNLTTDENRLFRRLFNILNATFPNPDMIVYLHRPADSLLDNIKKRGRNYEKEITASYLLGIQKAYFDYFMIEKTIPILILEMDHHDFVADTDLYQTILNLVLKKYPAGIHRVSI